MRKLITAFFVLALGLLGADQALALESPHLFSARNLGGGNVHLSWTQVPGATYQITYGPTDNPMVHGTVAGDSNSTIRALFQNTTYVFTVKAVRNGDVSGYSNSVRVAVGSGRTTLRAHHGQKQAGAKQFGHDRDHFGPHDRRALGGRHHIGQQVEGGIITPAVHHDPSTDTMRTNAGLNSPLISSGKSGVGHLNLRSTRGPASGQITLFWNQPEVHNAGDFNITYTDDLSMAKWGVLNISSSSRSFTVGALVPGRRYYFKMSSTNTGNTPWVSDIAR